MRAHLPVAAIPPSSQAEAMKAAARPSRLRAGRLLAAAAAAVVLLIPAACGAGTTRTQASRPPHATVAASTPTAATASRTPHSTPSAAADIVYRHTQAGDLSPAARAARPLVYVPNNLSSTMDVIDPKTYRVIARYDVPIGPEHVSPNHDMSMLYVGSDRGNAVTPIDPRTGKLGKPIHVMDVYNMYFTPDGKYALVMASRLHRINVLDVKTFKLVRSLKVPCEGINHADYTADLHTLLASCEFGGTLVVTDADATTVKKVIDLNRIKTPGATSPSMAMKMGGPKNQLKPGATAMPQDVRLMPDGKHFLVADMLRNGVWVINAKTMTYERFIHTGLGAHGIYPSRTAEQVYVTDRDEGAISVLDAATLKIIDTWKIPGGGSPDMGGVTADGSQLWLSGRYDSCVYVFDTRTGKVIHTIKVGHGPHGLLVWPQPGRFSLGHTGNMR